MSNLSLGSFTALTAEIAARSSSWTNDSAQSAVAGACGFVARTTAEKFCAEIEARLQLIRRLASEPAPPAQGARARATGGASIARSIERSGK